MLIPSITFALKYFVVTDPLGGMAYLAFLRFRSGRVGETKTINSLADRAGRLERDLTVVLASPKRTT